MIYLKWQCTKQYAIRNSIYQENLLITLKRMNLNEYDRTEYFFLLLLFYENSIKNGGIIYDGRLSTREI